MTDLLLEGWVSSLIELNKFEHMLGAGDAWKPGNKLKLLFAGYNGTRNTGSDVRVEEIIRQVRQDSGRPESGVKRDVAEFRAHPRIFRACTASSPAGRVSSVPTFRSPQERRRSGLRRLDVQKQIRQRADHHDDRRAGHRLGAK